MTPGKAEAIEKIRALAAKHDLSPGEIAAAISGDADAQGSRSRVFVQVLSYLGATFVFAGIGTFIAMHWDDFNSPARVIVSLGSGLAVFTLAVIALRDERYKAAPTPLFTVAAALMPTGLLVLFHEYGRGGDWQVAAMITTATVSLQYGLTYMGFRRTVLALFAIAFGAWFWALALDRIGLAPEVTALTVGAMLTLLAIPVQRSEHGPISPLLYLTGSWSFLFGLFEIAEGSPLEIVFLLTACFFVYLGILLRSRTLNFVSIVAILAYTGYFTAEHFADSVGWPLALIAFGLIMIGVSALGLRIDRKYLRKD